MNEPLGLPKGSIRGILAILTVSAALVSAFIETSNGSQSLLGSLAGMALTYYFKQREGAPNVEINSRSVERTK